jgi:anti-sigma factor RsiW
MARPLAKHIDDRELDALVPWASKGRKSRGLSPHAVRDAMHHVEACSMCSGKVSDYQRFVSQLSCLSACEPEATISDCPVGRDVDWHEVAAGLWPELKAQQLIMHASTCTHCGPRLRAATSLNDDASPEEQRLLAQLKTPSRPTIQAGPNTIPPCAERRPAWQLLLQWKMLMPCLALLLIGAFIGVRASSSRGSLTGAKFAELAVETHKQYVEGRLVLDLHTDSQPMVNHWFEGKTQFAVTVPTSPATPGEPRPYHLQGARVVQVSGKAAAYIAYQMQSDPVSLVIIPDSVAVASGGSQLSFKKVSFHYAMFEGYKVVTWSVHGLTYALVSKEGNRTQRSCMVCHSVMKDRDLSQTPTPLYSPRNLVEPVWQ